MKPLLIDLFCGAGSWTRAAVKHGWNAIGYDVDDVDYPGPLVRTPLPLPVEVFNRQKPTLVVASPPCEEYARRHLPWIKMVGPLDERLLRWAISLHGRLTCPIIIECSRFAGWEVEGGIEIGSHVFWGTVPALMPRPKRQKDRWSHVFLRNKRLRAAQRAAIPEETAEHIIRWRQRQVQ